MDQPDPQGLVGVHHAPGEDQIERAPLPDKPQKALRAGEPGNEPQLDLRLAETHRVGGDSECARKGELTPAAERKAVQRGNHRFAEVLEQLENVLPRHCVSLRLVGTKLRELLDVRARDKCLLASSGDDDDTDGVVALQLQRRPPDVVDRVGIERVEDAGPVDGDGRNAAIAFEEQVVEGHQERIIPHSHCAAVPTDAPARSPARSFRSNSRLGTKSWCASSLRP